MLARRDIAHNDCKCIILDYLQKLTPDNNKFSSDGKSCICHTRTQEDRQGSESTYYLSYSNDQEWDRRNLANGSKKAKDLKAEDQNDLIEPPSMIDLGQSGQIGREADVVAFLYRPEKMLRMREPDDRQSQEWAIYDKIARKYRGQTMIFLAKLRRGKDQVYSQLVFEPYATKFRDLVQ